MGLTRITAEEVSKHLPASILSLGWPDHLRENVDMSGSTLDVVDIVDHHHNERIADLSVLQDLGSYDLVLDCGTLEHVANIAHGFINAASSVKVGGRIIHELPLNMINHGYWNISPVWFSDFYESNGFVIERFDRTEDGTYYTSRLLEWPLSPTKYYFNLHEVSLTLCVAKRVDSKPIVLPKCQSMWMV